MPEITIETLSHQYKISLKEDQAYIFLQNLDYLFVEQNGLVTKQQGFVSRYIEVGKKELYIDYKWKFLGFAKATKGKSNLRIVEVDVSNISICNKTSSKLEASMMDFMGT